MRSNSDLMHRVGMAQIMEPDARNVATHDAPRKHEPDRLDEKTDTGAGDSAPSEPSDGPGGMDAIDDDTVREPGDESGPGGMNAIPPRHER